MKKIIFFLPLFFLVYSCSTYKLKNEIKYLIEFNYETLKQEEIERWIDESGYAYTNTHYDEGKDKYFRPYLLELSTFFDDSQSKLMITFYRKFHHKLKKDDFPIIYGVFTDLYGEPVVKKFAQPKCQIDHGKPVWVFERDIYMWKVKNRFVYLQEIETENDYFLQVRVSFTAFEPY